MQRAAPARPGTEADRLHPFIFFSFLPLAFFTAVFGPLLVLFPGSTDDFWSWEIRPDMSAVWVGAGYTFGAVAITTMLMRRSTVAAFVPIAGTLPFAIVMLAATIIHNERFFTDTANYYIWLAIYLYLPVALPVMLILNRRSDPGARPGEPVLPRPLRAVLCGLGLFTALSSIGLIFDLDTVVEAWP
jgi:hypothetical protein